MGDHPQAESMSANTGDGARVVGSLDGDGDGFDDALAQGDGLVLHRGTPKGLDPCWVGPEHLGSGVQERLCGCSWPHPRGGGR